MIAKHARVDLYSRVPLFSACTKKELAKVAGLTTVVDVAGGRVVCREGAPGREAFVIVEGEASVTIDGSELAVLGPGEFFGEMAVLDGGGRIATVTALTPMCVLVLSSGEFRQMLAQTPTVAIRVLAGLARRLRDADQRVPVGV